MTGREMAEAGEGTPGGTPPDKDPAAAAPLVDTHCHLDFPDYDADRDQVVQAAREAGVVAMITIGIDLASSRRAVELAERYAGVYAAVGIHPHSAAEVTPAALDELRRLARHPRVVAIGEIGLDYYRDRVPAPEQRRAFRAQLELAAECGLPVIIHNRDAEADVWDQLAGLAGTAGAPLRGVMHCFGAGPDWALRFCALGLYVGLDGPVTFKNGERAREVARVVPEDRLLVETDAPFLAPHPYRGRRNQPAWVRLVAERIAQERGRTLAEIARQTTANAARLFGLPVEP